MGVHVLLTPTLEAFFKEAWTKNTKLPGTLKSALEPLCAPSSNISDIFPHSEDHGISFTTLKECYAWMKIENEEKRFLHELMHGSKFFFPPAPVEPKDPELVKRLAKMQHQVQNRIYSKMVQNVSVDYQYEANSIEKAGLRSGIDTAKLGFNLLLSVIAVFAAVFFVIQTAYHDEVASILSATCAAIFIFLVEMILFVLRGTQVDSKIASIEERNEAGTSSPFGPVAPSLADKENQKRWDARRRKNQSNVKITSSETPIITLVDQKSDILIAGESKSNSLPLVSNHQSTQDPIKTNYVEEVSHGSGATIDDDI